MEAPLLPLAAIAYSKRSVCRPTCKGVANLRCRA